MCRTLRTEKVKEACIAAYEFVIADLITQVKIQKALIKADGFEEARRHKLVEIISLQALNEEKDRTDKKIDALGKFFFPQHKAQR